MGGPKHYICEWITSFPNILSIRHADSCVIFLFDLWIFEETNSMNQCTNCSLLHAEIPIDSFSIAYHLTQAQPLQWIKNGKKSWLSYIVFLISQLQNISYLIFFCISLIIDLVCCCWDIRKTKYGLLGYFETTLNKVVLVTEVVIGWLRYIFGIWVYAVGPALVMVKLISWLQKY